MGKPLQNYLRACRKQLGLTQDEVAFLAGCAGGFVVSSHESGRRLPALRMNWAYQVILRTEHRRLFKGAFQEVEQEVQQRAEALLTVVKLQPESAVRQRKLKVLGQIAHESSERPFE